MQGGSIVAFESLVSIQPYPRPLCILFNALNCKVGRYFENVDEVLDHPNDLFNSPFRLCCYSPNLSIGPSRSNPQAMNIQAIEQRFSLVLLFTVYWGEYKSVVKTLQSVDNILIFKEY